MSGSYMTEPDTNGEVLLQTTYGDIRIGLWSRETPKACRNFVQNCLERYYDGCLFWRLIKDFMVQTGDPTDTGDLCESVYGNPYPTEKHGRLQFRARGMVAVANRGKGTDSNGSQFFITLGECRMLNGLHTIFGKLVGNSMYNVMQMVESTEVDRNDRPENPEKGPRILRTEVVNNPFDDIEIRGDVLTRNMLKAGTTGSMGGLGDGEEVVEERKAIPATRKKAVLSFGDEDDSSDDESLGGPGGGKRELGATADSGPATKKPKMMSAHDLLQDETLLKEDAYDRGAVERELRAGGGAAATNGGAASSSSRAGGPGAKVAPPPRGGKWKRKGTTDAGDEDSSSSEEKDLLSREDDAAARQRAEKLESLKRQVYGQAHGHEEHEKKKKEKKKKASELLTEGYKKGVVRAKDRAEKDREQRSSQNYKLLEKFSQRIKKHRRNAADHDPSTGAGSAEAGGAEDGIDDSFALTGGLRFHTSADKAFELAAAREREKEEKEGRRGM